MTTIVSTTLFWPESVKMKLAGKASSVLTQLPANAVFRLALIALRKPKHGRTEEDRRAIKAVLNILSGKLAVVVFCALAALVLDGPDSLILLVPFLIFPLIDWKGWDQDLETELRRELDLRQKEIGIVTAELDMQRREMTPGVLDFVYGKVRKDNDLSLTERIFKSNTQSVKNGNQSTHERTRNGSLDRGHFAVVSGKEAKAMADIAITSIDELEVKAPEIAKRGEELYRNLPVTLIQENHGKFIRINVNSGEYILGDDGLELHKTWSKSFDDSVPSWNAVIGVPTYGGRANRLLQ